MLPQCSHITRKRGVYYYRRRLPQEYGGEIAVSLHTRSFRLAEWLAPRLSHVFQTVLNSSPMHPDIKAFLQKRLADSLHQVRDSLLATPYVPPSDPANISADEDTHDRELRAVEGMLENMRTTLRTRDIRPAMPAAREFAKEHGLPDDEKSLGELSLGLARVMFQQLEEKLRLLREGVIDRIELPTAASVSAAPAPASSALPTGPLASSLVEPFFERRATIDGTRHQVIGQERATLRRFIELCGDQSPSAYTRADVTRFLDTLRRLPKTYGKSPKDKDRTLAEIIAQADADVAERLTDKTVKRHLSSLSVFFQFAVDSGHMSKVQQNELVDEHRFKAGQGARHQRGAWTSEELVALFSSPIWRGCKSPGRRTEPGNQIIRDAKFWLPLLALYHGARLEEFADLYRRDISVDAGVWCINITEAGGRTLKTANSERVIALHGELIRMGFLEYAAATAPNADDPLFPDLKLQGPDQRRGPRITRWFVEYRKAIGIYREGVAMHSLRHAANTRLRDVIKDYQQERHVSYMFGHSQGGGEGRERYDKGPGLKAAAETLALLNYPELDFSHLHVQADDALRIDARA